ncbi:hypothetical protein C8F01DRAFT_1242390 [Mycena amicta]|nr:hypothetical protein C8F01DRAFT_1242390 [Mycena amicta]
MSKTLAPNFGPYLDSDVLSDFKLRTNNNKLILRNVVLTQDDIGIGLDDCERYLLAPPKATPVYFTGELLIDNLSWLSEGGLRIIQQNQDYSFEIPLPQRYMTGSRITVRITCKKESAAMYMTADKFPDDLVLISTHCHRPFCIDILTNGSYARSRDFFARFRYVKYIRRITEMPAYRPPLGVDPFIEAFCQIEAEDILKSKNPNSSARHASRAEIRQRMAPHAGWLLAFFLLKRRTLDVQSWCAFIHEAELTHRNRDSTWKSAYGGYSGPIDHSLATIANTLKRFGGTAAQWLKKLEDAVGQPPPVPAHQLFDIDTAIRAPSPSSDSDFSQPSTPGWSEYDTEPEDPDVANITLPTWFDLFRDEPQFRRNSFIWECPMPKCDHLLDFLSLPPVHPEDQLERYVRERKWETVDDVKVLRVLDRRVYDHVCLFHPFTFFIYLKIK